MGGNANETSSPATEVSTSGDAEATGPLSILPICVSLIAVVALAIAACVFYRKRQRQQAQQLARQLRVTERRIDAVGNLTVKKEKELAARRSEYYPPSDVRASASEPSVIRPPPHYFVHANKPGLNATRAKAVQTSIVNASACSCEYGASTYCSACKDSVLESHQADSKAAMEERDMSAGSLAVELATVPSVSSLTTVHTASKPPELRRTRSEFSQTSHSQNKTLVGYGSATSTPSREDATTTTIRAWMAGSSSAKPSTTSFLHSPLYPAQPSHPPLSGPQLAMSPTNTTCTTATEPEGRPNTPVSRSPTSEEGRDMEQQAMEYTSDDALSEKWV